MDKFPNVSSFPDKKGVLRWRFRKTGHKTVMLPGQPGEPQFQAAYEAILAGQKPKPAAQVVRHPSSAAPRSLRAAWKIVTTKTPAWKKLEPVSRDRQRAIAERFLSARIDEARPMTWGEAPIADLRRRHINAILAERSETPHATRHLLGAIRKMISAAMDEEWIENDPSQGISYRPEYTGWRAWTTEERLAFEKRWPVGTTPRTAYALALWLGNRRGDVATLTVAAIKGDLVEVTQGKTGKKLRIAITPMLREALDAADLSGPTVIKTAYGEPFSTKGLTGRMAEWTKAAGIGPGCTFHGLRKTLGKLLAEGGATTRQLMDTLGHSDIAHAELYSREADQERLARDGLNLVTGMFGRAKIKPV